MMTGLLPCKKYPMAKLPLKEKKIIKSKRITMTVVNFLSGILDHKANVEHILQLNQNQHPYDVNLELEAYYMDLKQLRLLALYNY
jgi:hypothetical protein